MKKALVLIGLLLITSTHFGQISIAPIVGVSYSSKSGMYMKSDDNKSSNTFIFGILGGLALNIELSKMISIQTEFLYIQKGMSTADLYPYYTFAVGGVFRPGEYNVKYNYLEIPLLVKFTFGNKFKYYFAAGPYIGYAINGKYKFDPAYAYIAQSSSGRILFIEFTQENSKKGRPHDPYYYNQLDVGGYVSAGVEKTLGPGTLAIDFRFGMGFIDYYKIENFVYVLDEYQPFYNRNFNLSVAYYIPILKQ